MGKIIVVVGTTGVGKTTLVKALSKQRFFNVGLEQHETRPFQQAFKKDHHYALSNQIDYLLLRAEQERLIRKSTYTGLMDGGLDMDFHGFTRLFRHRSWLTEAEFDLCKRFYELARTFLPQPDLVIYLTATPDVISKRLSKRQRINITNAGDSLLLSSFLDSWVSSLSSDNLIRLDVSENDHSFKRQLPSLLSLIHPYYNS
jgi:deoxyadenosine/deoxycytidine kinase